MRKFSILFLTAFTFITISCGNFLSDVKDEDVKMHSLVSNLNFDSIGLRLTGDTNAKDGTVITAVCNGVELQSVAANGRIEYILDAVFHDGVLGGRSYGIHFSADGYLDRNDSIQYWPIVEWEMPIMTQEVTTSEGNYIRELDRMPVFVGGADDFKLPEVTIKNYDKNSVAVKTTFKLYENYDQPEMQELDVNTSNWTVRDLKDFFSDSANLGKTVEANYSIRPKCSNGDELEMGTWLAFDCADDVQVLSAQIKYEYGEYYPYLYDTTVYNSSSNLAGGNIAYQWQSSDDGGNTWTDIEGATEKTYKITEEDIGKVVRLQIIQTMGEGEPHAVVSDTDLMSNHILSYSLYYDGDIKVGESFDETKIRGTLTDSLGQTYNAEDCTWKKIEPSGFYVANEDKGSWYFDFTASCLKEGSDTEKIFEDNAEVFATVRYADLEETPELSTEIDKISYGKVEFAVANRDYEYSADNGATYKELGTEEIKIGSNKTLYIRKCALGTPGYMGYIKESEPVQLIASEENIGIKTLAAGDGIISGVKVPKVTLEKSESGNTITVTPRLTNTEDWFTYEYIWRIDGNLLSECEWNNDGVSTSMTGDALYINKTKLPKGDTYMIFCIVKISGEGLEGELFSLSDQISVRVQ